MGSWKVERPVPGVGRLPHTWIAKNHLNCSSTLFLDVYLANTRTAIRRQRSGMDAGLVTKFHQYLDPTTSADVLTIHGRCTPIKRGMLVPLRLDSFDPPATFLPLLQTAQRVQSSYSKQRRGQHVSLCPQSLDTYCVVPQTGRG
jgi:hypothetical protein